MVEIRTARAEAAFDRLDAEIAALIKGMLARGDKQSDIAACFLINGGRVSEINTGERFPEVAAAPLEALPPPGPYPSPFELWKAGRGMWRARVALEEAEDAMRGALVAVRKAEQKL
jgi:hypothetical protein